jgi:hypothetical protein
VLLAGYGTHHTHPVGLDPSLTAPARINRQQHTMTQTRLPQDPDQDPPQAARTIAGLLALRDQVISPILAGVRSPRLGRKPAHWTTIDRDYETLRIGMQTLFHDLGITTSSAAA